MTATITGRKGESIFARQGRLDSVSDCMALLDFLVMVHAVCCLGIERRREYANAINQYPFLIGVYRISAIPFTSFNKSYE